MLVGARYDGAVGDAITGVLPDGLLGPTRLVQCPGKNGFTRYASEVLGVGHVCSREVRSHECEVNAALFGSSVGRLASEQGLRRLQCTWCASDMATRNRVGPLFARDQRVSTWITRSQLGGLKMSLADSFNPDAGLGADSGVLGLPASPVPSTTSQRPLHRLAEVRRRQGVSVRSVARRMQTSMEQVRRQEDATSDMTLSNLYRWQQALEVPIAELLVDIDAPLSQPVLTRARLLRVMKTVRAMSETAQDQSLLRLCQMLEQQLVEIMPELEGVSAWHSVGQRRTKDELGRVAERPLPESFFNDVGRQPERRHPRSAR